MFSHDGKQALGPFVSQLNIALLISRMEGSNSTLKLCFGILTRIRIQAWRSKLNKKVEKELRSCIEGVNSGNEDSFNWETNGLNGLLY